MQDRFYGRNLTALFTIDSNTNDIKVGNIFKYSTE